MDHLLPGDILLFAPQNDAGWRIDTEEKLIAFGERLVHPHATGPLFIHAAIVLSETIYAQEDGIVHPSQIAHIPATQSVFVKRLALSDEQRSRIPNAARSMYGERYDYMLDVYLGLRYLATGLHYATRNYTGGLIALPPLLVGHESRDRLICSTYVARVLRIAGYKGIRKRYPSPEGLRLLPGRLFPLPR